MNNLERCFSRGSWRAGGAGRRAMRSLAFAALLGSATNANAVACNSTGVGPLNWNAPASWSCGHVPLVADDVTIIGNSTVNVNIAGAVANSVIVGNAANSRLSSLTFSAATSSLTVTNNVTITAPTSNTAGRDRRILVNAGTLNVGGNVILNGSTFANTYTRLTLTTGTATIAGGLTVNSSTTAGRAVVTAGTGTINVNGAAGVANGDLITVGAGTVNVTNAAATYANSSATIAANTTLTTGTLNVAGDLLNDATDAMSLSNTGNITVAGTITNAGTLTTGVGTVNAATFTNNNVVTVSSGLINISGNFDNNGTFTGGTGTVTFNGTVAQTLGGTAATIFNNLIINKASGDVTITSASVALSPTVNGILTLTSGHVIATVGTNDLGLGTAGTVSGGSAASHVVGTVQKNYAALGTLTFPVGDGTNYTPVVIQGTAGFTAGSLTIGTTGGGDHPSIASSGIDATRSVNRYWTLTPTGLPAGSTYNATFNYINGSPVDFDAGATPANFIVEQWNGTSWFPTTLNATCTATPGTNLCKQINGETGFGDFAIGEPFIGFNGNPGAFNAFETATPVGVLGRIYSKIIGTSIPLSIVAVINNGVNTTYNTNPITVDLLDARDNTGAITAATNCRSTWTAVLSTQTLAPTWASGRASVTITAPANAARDVRVRVTQGVNIGCSTDRFAIRPTAFSSITSTANNNTTGAGTTIKTGQNFTISALTGLSGYDNGAGNTLASPQIIPLMDTAQVVGSPNAGSIGGSFGAASGGTASGSTFYYSEVGNFGLNANAIYDNVFTAVDQPGDCVTAAGSNFANTVDANGQYGCNFGSTAVALTPGTSGFGRFIPDNFAVSYNTPQFGTACGAGAFSYVGQPFTYGAAPMLTVTARNGTTNGLANAATKNYAGAYMKFSNAAGTSLNQAPYNTQAGRYSRFDALGGGATPVLDTSALPLTTADPAIGTFTNGVGALTFSSGTTGLAFARSTTAPNAPFNADIALTINVVDTDGVASAGAASFGTATSGGGIAFSSGNNFRFGRLKLSSAYGSELLDLPMPIETQYWTGTAFVTNSADSCTNLTAANLTLGGYQYNGGATWTTTVSFTGPFSAGRGNLKLTKPSPAPSSKGSVNLTVDLSPTGENKTYLQGAWSHASYDQSPTARATFGVYKGNKEFIYLRENY